MLPGESLVFDHGALVEPSQINEFSFRVCNNYLKSSQVVLNQLKEVGLWRLGHMIALMKHMHLCCVILKSGSSI